MQAIILAAGMGRRLGELTSRNTKCMLKVNGVRLIDRMLEQLSKLQLCRIVIVVGYEGENLCKHLRDYWSHLPIEIVWNKVYDKTNNIYSLWLAKEYMDLDNQTLLLESDLIFDDAVLTAAVDTNSRNVALVSKYQTWMDGTMVRINSEGNIVNFISKKNFSYQEVGEYYKTVNIYKFSRDFLVNQYIPFLEAYIKVMGNNEYYEQVLKIITFIDVIDLQALDIRNLHWYEIDDVQDLRIAETIFAQPAQRLEKLQKSYGGYWRYPGILDFCYLVNPYFPSTRMLEELKSNFEVLIRDYPSGMSINTMLAAKYFGISKDYVCIGNGAAELIKVLMEDIEGKVGLVYPTFEEYPNRLDVKKRIVYTPDSSDFHYSSNDLINFFSDADIDALLIVNPDNPSGNFINKSNLLSLAEWSRQRGICLIVDESFVDFSIDFEANTLLSNSILEEYKNLIIVKSISKSYGVPGLRLGILATGNLERVHKLSRKLPIWNINSFAEFYLQIYGKYESDYRSACRLFREERERFGNELGKIDWLRVIPSEANYFLIEILNGYTSYECALRLLTEFNILIKNCSGKKGFLPDSQYIRVAVRGRAENDKLVAALKLLF